jgi:hypothetical protein
MILEKAFSQKKDPRADLASPTIMVQLDRLVISGALKQNISGES